MPATQLHSSMAMIGKVGRLKFVKIASLGLLVEASEQEAASAVALADEGDLLVEAASVAVVAMVEAMEVAVATVADMVALVVAAAAALVAIVEVLIQVLLQLLQLPTPSPTLRLPAENEAN